MSAFNPKNNAKSEQEWLAIADDTNNETGQFSHFTTGGGLILGLITFAASANPIFGLSVAAFCLYSGWSRRQATNKNMMAIRNYHLASPFLKGDNFKDFCAQVGEERVLAEIEWAIQRGFRVSQEAMDLYENRNQPAPPKKAVLGERTKIFALDVPSRAVNESEETEIIFPQTLPKTAQETLRQSNEEIYKPIDSTKPPKNPKTDQANFDIIDKMASSLANHLIVGMQGSGKGIIVSNALVEIKRRHPQLTIFVVDPKNDEKEFGYFENTADIIRRAKTPEMEPSEVVDWTRRCIKEFQEVEGEKLLVLDEGTNITSAFKASTKEDMNWLRYILSSFVSCGDSAGLRIWIICQNAHLEELGFNGGLRSQFVAVAIVSTKNIGYLGALLQTSFIPKNQKLDVSQIEKMATQSPVNRCIYYGGVNAWYPMSRLNNLSGYDRDTRRFIASAESPVVENQEQEEDQAEKQQQDTTTVELKVSDSLSEPLKTIWLFAKERKDWITVRDIQQRNFGVLKGKSAEQIHQLVGLLADGGYGQIDEDGKSHSAVAFRVG